MKRHFRNIIYQTARLTGWRWLVMLTGLSLLAACSGNSDKKKTDTGNKPDSENVTCYAPRVTDTSARETSADQSGKITAEPDSQTTDPFQPPPQTCYAPIDPSQLNNGE